MRDIPLSGFSLGPSNQQFKSLFELLERYLFVELRYILEGEENEDFPLYTPNVDLKGYQIKPKRDVTGIRLNSLEKINISRYFLGIEGRFERFTSSGCAIHTNTMNAVYNSILEQLENHFISYQLLENKAPLQVDSDKDKYCEFIKNHLSKFDYELKTLCFLECGYPIYVSLILQKDNQFPYMFYGIGMDMVPALGLQKSVKEALMCWALELPEAKENFQRKFEMLGDVSQSARFYPPKASEHFIKKWKNGEILSQKQILKVDYQKNLLKLIEEFDFLVFPITSTCGNLTFVKSFSEKIIPKSYSKYPFLPNCDTVRQIENLKKYPF